MVGAVTDVLRLLAIAVPEFGERLVGVAVDLFVVGDVYLMIA